MSGSLQLIVVSMPSGQGPADRLLAEIDRLQWRSGVRVVDVLVVSKRNDGTLVQASFGDDDFGLLIARLFPVGQAAEAPADDVVADLWARAEQLPAGTAAAYLLVEHRWADRILNLVDAEGGQLLSAGFLTPELAVAIDAQISAMESAAQSIAESEAAEADARVRAVAAQAEADRAVADATRIRSAAAAEALQALMDAGIIEAAATQEALDALDASGIVIAAAGEAADRAVEVDMSTVAAADEAAVEELAADTAAVAEADEQRADAAKAASVTPAELRVLRYLSTGLTFALIADKLGISREAAKSRAERMYKRLGVHSRGEAVDRARELRVLP